MLILPDPDLDFRAADHLGAAKSAAIGVMWLIIDFSHHNLFQFCADLQNDSLFSLNFQEKYPSSCSSSLAAPLYFPTLSEQYSDEGAPLLVSFSAHCLLTGTWWAGTDHFFLETRIPAHHVPSLEKICWFFRKLFSHWGDYADIPGISIST